MPQINISVKEILEKVDINWDQVKEDRKYFENDHDEILTEIAQLNRKMMQKFGVDIGNLLVHTADVHILNDYPNTSTWYRGLAYAIWGKENEIKYGGGVENDLTTV